MVHETRLKLIRDTDCLKVFYKVDTFDNWVKELTSWDQKCTLKLFEIAAMLKNYYYTYKSLSVYSLLPLIATSWEKSFHERI